MKTKKDKEYLIYITTNLQNGKQYIGYHHGYDDDDYLGSGKEILAAIKKYGKKNFTRDILERCESKETAKEQEKKWIAFYNAVEDKNFYNLSKGGEYDIGWEQLHEWRKRNPEKARELDLQAKARLIEWWKNHPEAWAERDARLKEHSTKWREEHPEEVQEIMKKVNAAKEKWQKEHPEEYQAEVDRWRRMGSEANSQKIRCITTGEIFPSQCEAARHYNIIQANISKVLKGERKSAGKHPVTGAKLYWERVIED